MYKQAAGTDSRLDRSSNVIHPVQDLMDKHLVKPSTREAYRDLVMHGLRDAQMPLCR
jgi:hypothetical protein